MSSSSLGDGSLGDYFQQQDQPSQNAITAFLAKLWALVNDSACDDLIAWDPTGASFHVYDQSRFSREILPRYFKHNNFASFIRQLNMYGFRKMSTIEHGSLKNERDDIEFAHPNFLRGQDTLLELIKRRAPDNQQKVNLPPIKTELPIPSSLLSNQHLETKPTRPAELGHLLDDVRTLQNKQTSLSDKLFHLEDENQALWREIGTLRQKHSKQQQIVSKLMEFLLHILTNSTQNHRRSVEQPLSNQSQQEQKSHQTINLDSISSHSLKRKPAALMLSEEPNKRTTMQQQQPTHTDGQQRVIINELTDNDIANWQHTTNTSPVIDLVPSPPSSVQHRDVDYLPSNNNYEWIVPSDELTNSLHFPAQNKTFQNVNDESETFLPDFFLNTDDDHNSVNTNNGSTLTDINTSHSRSTKLLPTMKEEQIELSNIFHPHSDNNIQYNGTLNSSIFPTNGQPSETVSFSLDEFTGHVDHIQTSLNNIREFMFNKLPDGTSINDLFDDDHVLLSPLLPATSNLLAEDDPHAKSTPDFYYPCQSLDDSTILTQSESLIPHHQTAMKTNEPFSQVNNELLEQLIHETAKIEEQRHAINQLEREKMKLQGKIHLLEQQQTRK